ncbi:MAG TPA: hypothetical protein VGR16_10775 [Thermomicrobiales bacterium]|nr:hypothetical protein [Thermomicrobiales bacterium]
MQATVGLHAERRRVGEGAEETAFVAAAPGDSDGKAATPEGGEISLDGHPSGALLQTRAYPVGKTARPPRRVRQPSALPSGNAAVSPILVRPGQVWRWDAVRPGAAAAGYQAQPTTWPAVPLHFPSGLQSAASLSG